MALVAAALLALAFWQMAGQRAGLAVRTAEVAGTPVTIFADPDAPPGPAVVIAHGFAGSQQLMAPMAVTLARAGYVAVTFDALGHGTSPAPLTGDVTREDGATAALVDELERVAAFARALPGSDGRLALVGHSMASDIVARAADAPGVAATVGLSMFSTVVTADYPRNLLVIVGAGEPQLRDEALRVAGLAAGGEAAAGVTYGDPAAGTGRRAVVAPGVEHVGILYSATAMREARAWLDATFGRSSAAPVDRRAPWIGVWLVAALGLGWALAPFLPRSDAAPPPPLPRRRVWLALLLPPALTPPLAALAPQGVLPVPVADYLSVHFLLYGVLTLALTRRWPRIGRAALAGALLYAGFALAVVFLPLDRFVAAFVPTPERLPLLAMLLAGLLPYFVADEALTRDAGAPRGAYVLSKLLFLVSLGVALAIDPPRLFFLVLILPVMLLFFIIFGAFSRWSAGATGSAAPAALGNAALFAWAIAVTFPILGA